MSPDMYPLTVTRDRYAGTYSGGEWIAWHLDADEVPMDPWRSDPIAWSFWGGDHERYTYGLGGTIEEAIENLQSKLRTL